MICLRNVDPPQVEVIAVTKMLMEWMMVGHLILNVMISLSTPENNHVAFWVSPLCKTTWNMLISYTYVCIYTYIYIHINSVCIHEICKCTWTMQIMTIHIPIPHYVLHYDVCSYICSLWASPHPHVPRNGVCMCSIHTYTYISVCIFCERPHVPVSPVGVFVCMHLYLYVYFVSVPTSPCPQ